MEELSQLLSSGVVNSLKVVDSNGCHALNLALQAGKKATVEVRGQGEGARGPRGEVRGHGRLLGIALTGYHST